MTDLITRLKEGEGADRELDLAIDEKYNGRIPRSQRAPLSPQEWVPWPEYTASLDACITLAEKVLPNVYISVRGASGPGTVNEWIVTIKNESAKHKSMLRAFLIALITAKEAENDRQKF